MTVRRTTRAPRKRSGNSKPDIDPHVQAMSPGWFWNSIGLLIGTEFVMVQRVHGAVAFRGRAGLSRERGGRSFLVHPRRSVCAHW